MMLKPKNWIAETLWKPKKTHSLEQLRYLHYVLQRNSTVTEANKSLVVETLRSIAEILIWGDQNDSTVFDFFLEKNMLLFFLKFMTQSCGSYVTVQLLQTLNILFENIRHETSLYFLLSNNHVNSIIVHKFDFSNEEVLAYYISFLKTLSLKLNRHTINFFFNERKSDFPLYTEGIKFFHHTESMVRIAVRTLTLNVYKVGHEKMLEFICDKTATPYFSNLIWFIGKHAIELDDCLTQESDHFKIDKLKSIVADHLDHLHYLQDILTLKINMLNIILTDHMVNRLVIPLYIYSLPNKGQLGEGTYDRVMISKLCALFLLTQHLLIMDHPPLVNAIVDVIFNEDDIRSSPYMPESPDIGRKSVLFNGSIYGPVRAFVPPPAPLESQLEASGITKDSYNLTMKLEMLTSDHKKRPPSSTFFVAGDGTIERTKVKHRAKEEGWSSDTDSAASYSSNAAEEDLLSLASQADRDAELAELEVEHAQKDSGELRSDESLSVSDVTRTSVDAEKLVEEDGSDKGFDDLANSRLQPDTSDATTSSQPSDRGNEDRPISKSGKGESSFTMEVAPAKPDRPRAVDEVLSSEPVLVTPKRVFLQTILQAFDCANGDCEAFFALCLVYTMLTNSGLRRELLRSVGITVAKDARDYNDEVLERMLALLEEGVRDGSKMRLVTFEMCLKVIRLLVIDESAVRLKDRHLAMIENIKEASTLQLRNFYKDDDMFLDMFEGEYHQMKAKPLNVEYLTMDASLLLQPTATPLTGIDFLRRLPCGDTERTQRAARVFILMRELVLDVTGERELYLPLSYVERPVKENEVLDLNNSDLIACTIVQPSKQSVRRFMVIDSSQFILVEPDTSKLGWGVVKFVAHLQDVEANPDKDDSRSLYLVVQQPFSRRSKSGIVPIPLLTARFVFDDYIRCMSARQRLQKRRDALRHHKMSTVARLLELPVMAAPPSHYYTIAPYESSSTVWSPSSRAYTGARAVKSSPIVSQEVGQNLNLSLPAIALKTSTLLSPKHTEILQKQIKQDRVDGDLQDVEPSASSTPVQLASQSAFDRRVDRRLGVSKSQAQTLASVLDSSDGPEEYFGCSEVRRRSSTVESAEEEQESAVTLSEQDSSFIPMNVSASVERSVTAPAAVPRRRSAGPAQKVKATKISAKASSATSTKTKPAAGPTAVCDDAAVLSVSQERGRPVQAHADDRRHVPSKCQSAPGSPRGRRSRSEKERSLSEVRDARSLSAIGLETLLSGRAGLPTDQVGESDEARRQKAIRARAKVKTLKTKKLRR